MNLVKALRVLIAAEICLGLISIAAGIVLKDSLPEMLQEYLALEHDHTWAALDYIQIAVGLVTCALLVAGWIGLWKLKPWSRLAYTAGWILSLFITPMIGPLVMHGIESVLSELVPLAAGMTLALIGDVP